jgi:hypothetical protein
MQSSRQVSRPPFLLPSSQAAGPPVVSCLRLLIQRDADNFQMPSAPYKLSQQHSLVCYETVSQNN